MQHTVPHASEPDFELPHWLAGVTRALGTRDLPARLVRLPVDHAVQPPAIRDEGGKIDKQQGRGSGGAEGH